MVKYVLQLQFEEEPNYQYIIDQVNDYQTNTKTNLSSLKIIESDQFEWLVKKLLKKSYLFYS